MRATFRSVKGLLLMTGVLVVLTILILLNTRATRIQAGLFAVPSSISSQPVSQSSSSPFPFWVAPGLVRVERPDAPGTASSISLSSARGETVDTQVIVQGPVVERLRPAWTLTAYSRCRSGRSVLAVQRELAAAVLLTTAGTGERLRRSTGFTLSSQQQGPAR